MAGNTVNLEFAGDAAKLAKASKDAEKAVTGVGDASSDASQDMAESSKSSEKLLDKFSKLGNAVSGAGDAIDSATGLLADYSQITSRAYEKSQAQARALNDVQQAQEDLNQATRDGSQALIDSGQAVVDAKQANLDLATATKQHADDVRQYGAASQEAKQDVIDMSQAQLDLKQANEDASQAQRDGNQATIDAKGAQLDLNDAQREAHPPDVEKWSQDLETFGPLLQGLVGITGLVTAAQWAWNAAQLASPTTWIIIGIGLVVAGVILLVTHMGLVKKAWEAAWKGIKIAASDTWDFIKQIPHWLGNAFSSVASVISAPFRTAFNFIADAWNNTIGRLSWTVPGWIPGIGGDTLSVPHIPKFHSGGTVPGTPGSEVLAVLQAGEHVDTASSQIGGGGGMTITINSGGSALDDLLVEVLAGAIGRLGGNVQAVLGKPGRG